SQRDFYQLFAYFNNVPEKGRAVKYGNSPPLVKAPTKEETNQLDKLSLEFGLAKARVLRLEDKLVASLYDWKTKVAPATLTPWSTTKDLAVAFPLDENPPLLVGDPSLTYVAGRVGNAAKFDGQIFLSSNAGKFGFDHRFTLSCWVKPEQ